MLLLGDVLVRQACRPGRANRPAAIFETQDGVKDQATYAELNARANRIANTLQVSKGDRVAVLGRNSLCYIAIYFALAKLGAVMVPVNFWYRRGEIEYTLEQSGATTFLVDDPFLDTVTGLAPTARAFSTLEQLAAASSGAEPGVAVADTDPHIILYTSGTTGFPKGAVLSHRAHYLHALAWALETRQSDDDVGIVVYPLFHTGGPDCVVLPHFIVGGTIVIHDGADAELMLDAVERHRLTNVFAVPTVWRRLLGAIDAREREVSSVRRCLGSSDTLAPDLLDGILARFDADIYVTYGLTEAGCILTYSRLTRDDRTKIASVGRPHPLTEVRVFDADGEDVPVGEVGEVVARGPTLMNGYWGLPERTAEAMADGWLHTGDLGFFDADGYLQIAGRAKDVIISGGEKIYPLEVERLIKQFPGVRDCALVGIPDPEWGESVLAAVVGRVDGEALKTFVRARLAGYKTPRYVEIVDTLPVTAATGKVQKSVLRERFAALTAQ